MTLAECIARAKYPHAAKRKMGSFPLTRPPRDRAAPLRTPVAATDVRTPGPKPSGIGG